VTASSGDALDLRRCPALSAARARALDLLARATAAVEARAGALGAIETIAVAGSLARLEFAPHSDLDAIVVVHAGASAADVAAALSAIADASASLGVPPPRSAGIYRQPVTRAALLDPGALGSLAESPEVFGKRIQLLIEGRPLYRHDRCRQLQRDIVAWYGTGYLDVAPAKSWTYLINDVVRYLHAYAARQQYRFARTADDSWELRQAKLRTTRVLGIAALLCLLGESNARADKQAWLVAQLARTPLERLALVMTRHDPAAFAELLSAWEEAYALLVDADLRRALLTGGPADPAGLGREASAAYRRLKPISQRIWRLLTDFLLDRRSDWDPRFFERLLL
jgi:hypothetical protein